MNWQFIENEIQMVLKHMKICLTSFMIHTHRYKIHGNTIFQLFKLEPQPQINHTD